MANYIFGGEDVESRTGGSSPRLAPEGTLVSVFTDPGATSAASGFKDAATDEALVNILVDENSQLPLFYLTADNLDTLYVQIGLSGPVRPIYAHPDERIDALVSSVAALASSVSEISGVKYLAIGAPVPPETPVNTLIVRPAS